MEMPVGVSVGEKSSDEDVNVDVSNIGKKRRAGNEIAPPSKIWRSVSVESSLKRKSSHVGDVGNDNAYRGAFTADQMRTIAACDELKAMAATNPKYLKRVLSNRESAARSKERKALRLSELEDKVQTLETQIDTLTAELKLEKRERMAADEECKRLRIRLNGGEEHAQLRDALIVHLTGEVTRLTAEASGQGEEMSRLREEVSEYRRRESERMNANMLEQLNINQQFQENIDPMKLGRGGFGIKD
ncbi:hypothetical protein N665_0847s0013 [Sinapis alba]|nr:hypothetical protein N665_0847s0013 [Sinapis alba]